MKKTLTLLLGLALAMAAQAQAPEVRRDALRAGLYAAPMLDYWQVDEERGTDDALGYAVALGYRGSFAAVELAAATVSLDTPAGGSADLQSLGVKFLMAPLVMLPVLRDVHFVLGYALNQRDGHPGFARDDETYFLDTGLAYMPTLEVFGLDLALRLEYLYRRDTQQPTFNENEPREFKDSVLRLGAQFPLSRRPPPPEQPAPGAVEVTPTDADGDGVADAQDRCPGTLANTSVDAQGCA